MGEDWLGFLQETKYSLRDVGRRHDKKWMDTNAKTVDQNFKEFWKLENDIFHLARPLHMYFNR